MIKKLIFFITLCVGFITCLPDKAVALGSVQEISLQAVLDKAVVKRPPTLTVQSFAVSLEEGSLTGGQDFYRLVSDSAYLASISEEEFGVLAGLLPYLPLSAQEANALVSLFTQKISVSYRSKPRVSQKNDRWEEKFHLTNRYALLSSALVGNEIAGAQMLDVLLAQVSTASQEDPSLSVWAAEALSGMTAVPASRTRSFENRIKESLLSLDFLKDEVVENSSTGIRLTNQQTAEKLFAYADSFLAKKPGDGFLKAMITSGAFVERDFYFENKVPGTNGTGGFLNTPSGLRHQIASDLVIALFVHYTLQNDQRAMRQFIRFYAQTDWTGGFKHYALLGRHALKVSLLLQDEQSLGGWADQYRAYVSAYANVVYQVSPGLREIVFAQGAAEVSCEWILVGKAFQCVGKALKVVGKAIGATERAVVSSLPLERSFQYAMLRAVAAKTPAVWGKQMASWIPPSAKTYVARVLKNPRFVRKLLPVKN